MLIIIAYLKKSYTCVKIRLVMEISGEDQMRHFGERIGRLSRPGLVIELIGDIGAGKTSLVKGLAVGMGVSEVVQSPTFNINRTYQAADGVYLSHYDFYRLDQAGVMMSEVQEVIDRQDSVVAIEWAEPVEAVLPTERMQIIIDIVSEDQRSVRLVASGAAAEAIREQLG